MVKVFFNIKELLTLKSAFKKQGRNVVEKDLSIIKDAAFISDAGKIIWVGKKSNLDSAISKLKINKYSEFSLNNATVMPAFVECHTHSVFAGNRSEEFELRNQGVSYQQIAKRGGGILSTVKATRKASLEDLTDSLQNRVDEFVRQGVATVEIKSGYGLNFPTEKKMLLAMSKVRTPRVVSTYLGAHAIPKEAANAAAYIQKLITKDLPYIAKNNLASRVDIFIEKGYFNKTLASQYLKAARGLGLTASVHTEQLNRTEGYKVALDNHASSIDHVIEVNSADINKIAKSDTTCVLLPGADFYLQMKYPPARQLIDRGARVAIATDFNPGSCPTQDLSLIGVLARLQMKMTLTEVICAYTLGAAFALNLQNEIGSLEVGKSCDFIVLDQGWDQLFYQVGHHPVQQTWWRGKKIF